MQQNLTKVRVIMETFRKENINHIPMELNLKACLSFKLAGYKTRDYNNTCIQDTFLNPVLTNKVNAIVKDEESPSF